MVRDDVNYKLRLMHVPSDVNDLLSQANSISFENKIGELSFYKLHDEKIQPKIFGAVDSMFYHSVNKNSFTEASPYANYLKDDIYTTDSDEDDKSYKKIYSKQILLKAHPSGSTKLDVAKENAEAELPYVRFLPDSRF